MTFTGIASVWDDFRASLGGETQWQYTDAHHRVDLATKSVTYTLNVVFKSGPSNPRYFPFAGYGDFQGMFTANGAGLLTFDENWKLASIWQQSYVDKMLVGGAYELGTYPTPESPYMSRSALGMLPVLANPQGYAGTCRSWCNAYTGMLSACST